MRKRERFTFPLPPGMRFSDFEWVVIPRPPRKPMRPPLTKKQRHFKKMNDQAIAKLARLDRQFEAVYVKYLEQKLAYFAEIIERDDKSLA
jgi:hypothetical protein